MSEGQVVRVVLTGGPCGGKTTVQVMLSDVFENMGWRVYRVPETATTLLNGGVVFSHLSEEQQKYFQYHLLRVMLAMEDTFMELAKSEAKKGWNAIVLCDRGAMDASAYMSRESWLEILKFDDLNEIELRDQRYDAVVHLVTAALGAEPHFGSENNRVRSEDIPVARHLDQLVAQAWVGHPYYDIVGNENIDFEQKKNRVIQCVLKRLGLADTRFGAQILKRKFLCKRKDLAGIECREFDVVHHYLATVSEVQTRIRKRGSLDGYLYTVTQRQPSPSGFIEVRRSIASREYEVLIAQKDPSRHPIVKKRHCFLWENQYFQLDEYLQIHEGLLLLEAYLKEDYSLPGFIEIEREVTSDPVYSMYQLALQ